MAIMAIDFGRRKIGLAIAESKDSPALPMRTIERISNVKDIETIAREVASREVTQLVVGLPLNMDGSEGAIAMAARKFGDLLGDRLKLPVDYTDERLTSIEARERLSGERGLRGGKTAIDAVAAAIILEDWLGTHRDAS
jgi:putative Holliday junction resolvase